MHIELRPLENRLEPSNQPIEPHPQHEQSRAGHVVWLAILTISVGIAAFVWLRGTGTSPSDQVRAMPPGAVALVGADVEHIVNNDWIRGFLDNPVARMGLSAVKDKSGIDVKQVRSAKGGLWLVDGSPRVLIVVDGEFDPTKLHGSLKAMSFGNVEIAENTLFGVAGLQYIPGSEAEASGESSGPRDTVNDDDVVIGQIDGGELIVGHLALVRQYLDGQTGGDETRSAQVEQVDSAAAAWMVGSTDNLTSALPDNDLAEKLAAFGQISYVGVLHIDVSLRIKLMLTAASESEAQNIETGLSLLTGMWSGLDTLPLGLGGSGLKPEITRTQNTVTVQLKAELPKQAPL